MPVPADHVRCRAEASTACRAGDSLAPAHGRAGGNAINGRRAEDRRRFAYARGPSRAGAPCRRAIGRSSDSQARSERPSRRAGLRVVRPGRLSDQSKVRARSAMAYQELSNRRFVRQIVRQTRLVTAAGPSRNCTGVPCCVGRSDVCRGRPPMHMNQSAGSLTPFGGAVKSLFVSLVASGLSTVPANGYIRSSRAFAVWRPRRRWDRKCQFNENSP
jgi:hypothetical protein